MSGLTDGKEFLRKLYYGVSRNSIEMESPGEIAIGFVGAGQMAFAICSGLIKYAKIRPSQISISAPSDRNLPKFKQLGCYTTNDNDELLLNKRCSIIFLCCKPYHLTSCVEAKQPFFKFGYLGCKFAFISGTLTIISVLAGTLVSTITKAICGEYADAADFVVFVRTMPNMACLIGEGIFPLYREPSTDTEFDKFLLSLLGPLGFCEFVPESQLDVLCGLGGSGLAFVYTVIQSMADGAVKMGLPRQSATKFAAQTVLGAGKMVLDSGRHPIQLRDECCSPAGTTIHGIHEMERAGVHSGLMDAIEAATKRANQYAQK